MGIVASGLSLGMLGPQTQMFFWGGAQAASATPATGRGRRARRVPVGGGAREGRAGTGKRRFWQTPLAFYGHNGGGAGRGAAARPPAGRQAKVLSERRPEEEAACPPSLPFPGWDALGQDGEEANGLLHLHCPCAAPEGLRWSCEGPTVPSHREAGPSPRRERAQQRSGAGEAPAVLWMGSLAQRWGRSGRTSALLFLWLAPNPDPPLSSFPPAGPSALQPPPGDPPQPQEAVLGSLQPTALQVETLGPDLQTGAAALPSSLQEPEVEGLIRPGLSAGQMDRRRRRRRLQSQGYHPECFTCVDCSRQIGSDAFAVDEEQRALCLPDFYRRFAPVCGVCEEPIIPQDGRDAYRIECLGRSFHEDCYRCEVEVPGLALPGAHGGRVLPPWQPPPMPSLPRLADPVLPRRRRWMLIALGSGAQEG
ncbi:hypothetical protein E2320_006181 [Naja naja]|nr:hypothetical protein E2320_006181 [Naja naja]